MTATPPPASAPHPSSDPPSRGARRLIAWLLWIGILLLVPAWLCADWWVGLPSDAQPTYVGRTSCVTCHSSEAQKWTGSHHDLAMDLATPETVLGDFNDVTLEHFGVTSRMFRQGERFVVNTEGPDGKLHDYTIKYVFGVEPLQQYLVEFDRPSDMPAHEQSRLQVLRISWDTENKKWFYLSPPDVDTRLAPNDPLHWTGSAQSWNHMCASCHSTHLRKDFDVGSATYHTTFSEMDVSCEACHGPGSLHIELAQARSLFWDRKRGYALKPLKGTTSHAQIDTCAPCHSRRSMIAQCNGTSDESYFDCYESELLRPDTYYCDGQIRDEVYVYGSFVQSKMFAKGIRCTDCHDPHSTRLKFEGNQVCVSCHTHTPAKYDTPAHHHHAIGSTGSLCVECHMPSTPFMDIDPRRDHSLRVPRPDLSVKWQTPNACTGCHLDSEKISPETASGLVHYADWLSRAREGDEEVAAELARLDGWAADWVRKWYGKEPGPHFADALGAAWRGEIDAEQRLIQVIQSRDASAIVRASALWELYLQNPRSAHPWARKLIRNSHPQVRAVSIRCLADLPPQELTELVAPRLNDSVRLVRIEAANAMAVVPVESMKLDRLKAFTRAFEELQASHHVNSDLAGSHLMRGVLAERGRKPQEAIQAYRTAIHVQPDVVGPRSNLAQLLEQMGDAERAQQYRTEELALLKRDAEFAPEIASVQYRYGLSLYLSGRPEQARPALERACQLEPDNADYHLALALLDEHLRNWPEALEGIRRVRRLRPNSPELMGVEQRLLRQFQPNSPGPGRD